MVRYKILFLSVIALLSLSSCDESLGEIGSDLMFSRDIITTKSDSTLLSTCTVRALPNSIVSNTSDCYLGQYTDTITNIITTCDYLTQFYTVENFNFPKGAIADSIELSLYVDSYIGDYVDKDSVNNRIAFSVYPIKDGTRLEGRDEEGKGLVFYTDVDPTQFVDFSNAPLATYDDTIPRLQPLTPGTNYYQNIRLKLPKAYGERIVNLYNQHPEYFSETKHFIDNVCAGVYIKYDSGNGAIMKMYTTAMHIFFHYNADGTTCQNIVEGTHAKDCTDCKSGIKRIAATGEVAQITRTQNNISDLFVELANAGDSTYIYSPAGLFTEVTLPIDEILSKRGDYELNNARISFSSPSSIDSTHVVLPPDNVLLIPKSQAYSFFTEGRIHDNDSTYLSTIGVSGKKEYYYAFSDISKLVNWMDAHRTTNTDWDKALLVPVKVISNKVSNGISSNNVVYGIYHEFSVGGVRLKKNPMLHFVFSKYGRREN